jgi:hypothetical protein
MIETSGIIIFGGLCYPYVGLLFYIDIVAGSFDEADSPGHLIFCEVGQRL